MTPFEIVIAACMVVVGLVMVAAVVLMLRVKDSGSRAVLSDLLFFSMIALYLLWTFTHPTHIAFDIVFLATLACLSTVSLARILSNGRR